MCLVLDFERLRASVESYATDHQLCWGLGEVSYQSADLEQSLGFFDARRLLREGAEASLLKNFESSLLTKHSDWAHETEFRFLVMDGLDEAILIPVASDVFAGVVLGPTFNPTRHMRNVGAFARSFAIRGRVRALHWTNGRAELVPVWPVPPPEADLTTKGSDSAGQPR